MSLLQDLTDMMEEVELSLCKSSDPNSSSTCDIEKADADTQETKEARNLKILLDLELELEESMCKIRKRMMVTRLIGLMSEDDILKDSLLNNSGKMIEVRIISVLPRYNGIESFRSIKSTDYYLYFVVHSVHHSQSCNCLSKTRSS